MVKMINMNWKACQHIELSSTTTTMTDKTVSCTMNGSIIKATNLFNLANYTIPGAKLEEEQMDAAF